MKDMFFVDYYDYDLPQELIAFEPAKRGGSKMLHLDRQLKSLSDRYVKDLPMYIDDKTIVVFNNSRVIPARLIGKKAESGGKVDCVLIENLGNDHALGQFIWKALIKGRRLSPGQKLIFPKGVGAQFLGNGLLAFEHEISLELLSKIGLMPLPPYIKRVPNAQDFYNYQTVYAKENGSIAAPTAGLHFTETLLEQIRERAFKVIEITLHVGYGTFAPVKARDIREHKMHSEWFSARKSDIELILNTRDEKRVLAIGTTSVRVLESIAVSLDQGELEEADGLYCGKTDIFIHPPYAFRMVDALFTNFHLPKSTLLMLVSAFAGRDTLLDAYRYAIERKYRFFSYGDAMLIT